MLKRIRSDKVKCTLRVVIQSVIFRQKPRFAHVQVEIKRSELTSQGLLRLRPGGPQPDHLYGQNADAI